MTSDLEPIVTMHVWTDPDHSTRATVSHPAPVPAILLDVVNGRHQLLHVPATFWAPWEPTVDANGLRAETSFHGRWSVERAVRAADILRRSLGYVREDETPEWVDRDGYPLQFVFNGERFDSFEAFKARFNTLTPSVHELGAFKLTRPLLLARDPSDCFRAPPLPLPAAPGRWQARVSFGPKYGFVGPIALQVQHADADDDRMLDWRTLERIESVILIDAAMCGFFDEARFPYDDDSLPNPSAGSEELTHRCGDTTRAVGIPNAVVIDDLGAVAGLGGDGACYVYVRRRDDGLVDLAQLVFFGDLPSDYEDVE